MTIHHHVRQNDLTSVFMLIDDTVKFNKITTQHLDSGKIIYFPPHFYVKKVIFPFLLKLA